MQLETLVKEFLFECEIREYSLRTMENYKKQLRHFTDFLKEQCAVETLEDLQASNVKAFIKHYQLRQCKPSYVNDNLKAVKVPKSLSYLFLFHSWNRKRSSLSKLDLLSFF